MCRVVHHLMLPDGAQQAVLDPAPPVEQRPDVHAGRQLQTRAEDVFGEPAVRVQPRRHLLVAHPGGEGTRQEVPTPVS